VGLALLCALAPGALAGPRVDAAGSRVQATVLISRALHGGMPNGPSTHAVISGDKRFARVLAFQSEASNIVRHDSNGKIGDVFLTFRAGPIHNTGARWRPGRTVLVSKNARGRAGNRASFAPAVSGSVDHRPTRIAFLSRASNLGRGDTNGKADAFVAPIRGRSTGPARRVSLPGGRQANADTTAVAISGDGKKVAFVTGGKLYVSTGAGRKPRRVRAPGRAADPSFSAGKHDDLVFGARGGVYLSAEARARPRLVARGGRNPVYNNFNHRVLAYEKAKRGHTQIASRKLGGRERIVSRGAGSLGDGDSRDPMIGNSGFYVSFESEASNLGTNANGRTDDQNGMPDVYLYTAVRRITLVQSVVEKAHPMQGGGRHPSMSFYANYVVFDAPTVPGVRRGQPGLRIRDPYCDPLQERCPSPGSDQGSPFGPPQVYMRWLGAA
jgi:hypothetical protein